MNVSCEHSPLLTTGLAALAVQLRIPHLVYLFPHLIPFHASLPNFPFQCSFPTPHLPSKFLFFHSVFPLTTTHLPFDLWPVPNFFSACWEEPELSGTALQHPSLTSVGHCELPSPLGSPLGLLGMIPPLLSYPEITDWLGAMPKQLVVGIAGKAPSSSSSSRLYCIH